MRRTRVQFRNAFTLVELLVVIAIIVILMALTVGIMSRVWAFWDESKTNVEISKLSEGCHQFKANFGRFPPSRIILCENFADYATLIANGGAVGELAKYSAEYLVAIFPGIGTNPSVPQFDWNGNGIADRPNPNQPSGWVLEGEESLVYFLGGIRPGTTSTSRSAAIGFNTDKSNPTLITTVARLGPYFQFDEGRVSYDSPNAAPPAYAGSGGLFPIYKDNYGVAYAYFLPRTPGMNNYWFPGAPQMTGLPILQQQFLSDCYLLTKSKYPATSNVGLVPAWQSLLAAGNNVNVIYHKADTFQIISAGKDKLFGCGGELVTSNPESSRFDFMVNVPAFLPVGGVAVDDEKKAVFDNLTNAASGRVVPQ